MLRFCFSSPLLAAVDARIARLACSRGELVTAIIVASSSAAAVSCRSSSPLCISRRYQRSTPTRVRSSTWEEKTQKFKERQREQQAETERAARRRARYNVASSSTAPSPVASSSSKIDGKERSTGENAGDFASSSYSFSTSFPMSTNLTRPSRGFWSFVKGGTKGRRNQPLNPLMYLERLKGKSQFDPDARAAQRIIDAVNGLRRRNSRRQRPMTVQLSDDEKQEIVNRYVETRWYAGLYRPFRNITERQIRWALRLTHFGLIALLIGFLGVVFMVYTKEMDVVARLTPEDQRDYAYMVQHMRYSDIYNTGKVVLERDDPLEALPPEVRLRMVIDACREKRWHEVDWGVELRKAHPNTAYEDRDYIHLLYWLVMVVGRAMTCGGGLFNDRVLDVQKVRQGNAESPEERDRFVEMEPTALPTKTKRDFFS